MIRLFAFILFSAFLGMTPVAAQMSQADKIRGYLDQDAAEISKGYEAMGRKDWASAFEIFRLLARQGVPIAAHNIGVMYANGQGVSQDYSNAQSMFREAAGGGYPPAMRSLSIIWMNGEGVKVNYIEAYRWSRLAVLATGDAVQSQPYGKDIIDRTEALKKLLSPEDLAEAERRIARGTASSPAAIAAFERVKSLSDFNKVCEPYKNVRLGIRQADSRIREEIAAGKNDLVSCVAPIEYARMFKTCNDEDPVISEILFYTNVLEQIGAPFTNLPPIALMSSALVIGEYCEPEKPLTPDARTANAKLRAAYQQHVRPIKKSKG